MNRKQVIRINENQLKQIVMESVEQILREGKVTNNKPYFKKHKQWVGGGYPDYGDGYYQELPYNDYTNPSNEYAKKDNEIEPKEGIFPKLDAFPNWWDEFYDEDSGTSDPKTHFQAAGMLNQLRQERKDKNEEEEIANSRLRTNRLNALKKGIPSSIVKKLSSETLSSILFDLK